MQQFAQTQLGSAPQGNANYNFSYIPGEGNVDNNEHQPSRDEMLAVWQLIIDKHKTTPKPAAPPPPAPQSPAMQNLDPRMFINPANNPFGLR
jgi:hypothetical protein